MRGIAKKNHAVKCFEYAYAIVEGLEKRNGEIIASSDFRKGGDVDGY